MAAVIKFGFDVLEADGTTNRYLVLCTRDGELGALGRFKSKADAIAAVQADTSIEWASIHYRNDNFHLAYDRKPDGSRAWTKRKLRGPFVPDHTLN